MFWSWDFPSHLEPNYPFICFKYLCRSCHLKTNTANTEKSVLRPAEGPAQRQVFAQTAGACQAVCTGCTEVHGCVSKLDVCDVQGNLLSCLAEWNQESSLLRSRCIWTNVNNELEPLPSFLFVPREVGRATVRVSTADDRGVSLLHSQGAGKLLQLLCSAPCTEERKAEKVSDHSPQLTFSTVL